ncbi:hypothetical protein GCM10025772_12180 [Ferrimonas gelatinilytica]|uniref:Uncharacterized protein n=2 Tax=Ferrimonas gelatinilytica TaxID=1255257 RepID=A0ABP9S0Y0_9GAMM
MFGLLLVTAITVQKYTDLVAISESAIKTDKLLREINDLVDQLSERLVVADSDLSQQDYLEELLRLAESKIEVTEDWQTISSTLSIIKKHNITSNDIETLSGVLASRSIKELEQLQSDLSVARAQTRLLQRRSGLDFPTCLVSNSGRIRYLADITLKDEMFEVNNFSDEAEEFFEEEGEMSPESFLQRAQDALSKSKSQELECRYFVRVFDGTTSKRWYIERLQQVEQAFYKYLAGTKA